MPTESENHADSATAAGDGAADFHVLLLRHGQTDSNAGGVLQGHLPVPLTELGRRQAALLAARVAAWRPAVEVLVSSDLPRATQTADPIAAACGLRPVLDPAWRERRLGEMEGKTIGERETWRAASGEFDPPGAESVGEFQDRVMGALLDVYRRYRRQRVVAVVTHGGPIRTIVRVLGERNTGIRLDGPAELLTIANCSILHLVTRGVGTVPVWRMECANDVGHLADLVSEADSG